MKRTPLKRSTPMQRSSIKRRVPVAGSQKTAKAGAPAMRKCSRPKMTPIRKAARGQDCTLQFHGVCNRNPETTVLCHSNRIEDGKGWGVKAPDNKAVFGCSSCHDVLDGRAPRPAGMSRETMLEAFDRALSATHAILRRMGLL
jgi:hypothetical protein